MLKECEGPEGGGNAGVVVVSAGHVGNTHGSCIVSIAADMLWMSVVYGIRGAAEGCEMCMCLARAAWVERGVSR